MSSLKLHVFSLLASLLIASCDQDPVKSSATFSAVASKNQGSSSLEAVGAVSIETADSEWTGYGRDYAETRFSPLQQVNSESVASLGLAWSFETGQTRGHEATPLISAGVLFATRPWSSVFALNAETGELLWEFDPEVDRAMGGIACCDAVNRGVALYQDKVYLGALDGRLIALDASDGSVLWQVQTVDPERPYTITGAPRIADGKVIIGNGGAELGTRGYVTAYDADTGALAWRFWVVPGNPADGFENEDVAFAATTWSGTWWKTGGGGNAWDSIVYDPEARLVYVGTGNGSPWSHELRSNGQGDNLYLSSIVALRVDDGTVAWHYQTTPAENFDYTATQSLVLAELPINGVPRKVIMQAPKNGFFYVLDRITGDLIYADPYAEVTWASGIDLESGRPVETPQARYGKERALVMPGPNGAHNWHPMSFNPQTGLVYLPTIQGSGFPYSIKQGFVHKPGTWNLGVNRGDLTRIPERAADTFGEGTGPATRSPGALVAWDPLTREPRWVIDYPFSISGGTLTTAGNLVFQGAADGMLRAFAADTGTLLWARNLGVGIIAPPVTYELNGIQYVAILAGWGGSAGLLGADATGTYKGSGKLFVFSLNGDQVLEPVRGQVKNTLTPISFEATPEQLANGAHLYGNFCHVCHGGSAVSGGSIADLRYATAATYAIFDDIVRGGIYSSAGMPDLGDWISEDDAAAIRNWLLSQRSALLSKQELP